MFPAKVTYFCCLILLITQCKSDCKISVKSLQNILVLDKNNNIEYSNDGKGNIVKKDCEFITLACPGTTLKGSKVETQQFTCKKNDFTPKISGATCDTKLQNIEHKAGNCNGLNYHLQIGYQYKNGGILPQIDLCWDDGNKRPLWTYVKLQRQLAECPSDSTRPSWITGIYFDKALANKYLKTEQLLTLDKMFNHKIPPQLKDKYLQIGHLVAKCDFVYETQQQLTFHYINTAPQWDKGNMGNWKALEGQVRKYATAQGSDLDVYTGTNGIMEIDAHQYYLSGDIKKVPVPKYFWKVIIKGKLGVAIVETNDIFTKYSPICPDVLSQIKWLKLKSATDEKKGYMIACKVSDFIKISSLQKELPTFPSITGLLTS